MRRYEWLSRLAYLGEFLLLLVILILVVKFVPDMGKKPSKQENLTEEGSTQECNATGSDAYRADEDDEENGSGQIQDSLEGRGKETGKRKPWFSKEETNEISQTEAVYVPPTMIVASDLHYLSPAMTDYGEAFQDWMEADDGKVLRYSDQIIDAFLEEAAKKKPSVLILSGDISLNGEKVNHGELARKLRKFQKQGIQVLVVPGNHDINHPWAASYYGADRVETTGVDADGFYEIYHEFGYDQAADRDQDSLSYLYKLDEHYWLMMLDSCQYFPQNQVGGRIRKSTLKWMEQWLKEAEKEHVTVIPVAHHNLLNESVLYKTECTLENQNEVIRLLEKYRVPVYISGHLHLQRVKKHVIDPMSEGMYGIYEIVSNSLSIPPCQYGVIKWTENGSMEYHTKTVDVEAWAKANQSEDENLLKFSEYRDQFLIEIISNQIFRSVASIPEERKKEMADLYGALNSAYCAGKKVKRYEVKRLDSYFYWERYLGSTKWFDRLSAILKDTGNEQNSLHLRPGKDFYLNIGQD